MEGRKTTIIGITGGSGSGKTSVLQSILQQFAPKQVCMISQDDYYPYVASAMCGSASTDATVSTQFGQHQFGQHPDLLQFTTLACILLNFYSFRGK